MLHYVAHVHTSSCFRRSVQACTVFTDAARIATNFKKVAMQGLRNGRVSVRLSHRSTAAAACGGFAAERPAGTTAAGAGAQQQRRRSTALSSTNGFKGAGARGPVPPPKMPEVTRSPCQPKILVCSSTQNVQFKVICSLQS